MLWRVHGTAVDFPLSQVGPEAWSLKIGFSAEIVYADEIR
jgi:hypothetical protein